MSVIIFSFNGDTNFHMQHMMTVFIATSCFSYRKHQENYSDCLQYSFSTYGCYPKNWFENFLQDLDALTVGDNIEMMKQL